MPPVAGLATRIGSVPSGTVHRRRERPSRGAPHVRHHPPSSWSTAPSPTRPASPASSPSSSPTAPRCWRRRCPTAASPATRPTSPPSCARSTGPVLLVGHSYGGAVITVAGVEDNVVGLVYLAGYALDEGESLGELQGGFPDSPLAEALVYTPFPVTAPTSPAPTCRVDIEKFPADLRRRRRPRPRAGPGGLPAPAGRRGLRRAGVRRGLEDQARLGHRLVLRHAPSTPTSSASATSGRP